MPHHGKIHLELLYLQTRYADTINKENIEFLIRKKLETPLVVFVEKHP